MTIDLAGLLRSRRSVRKFLDDEIPRAEIEALVEQAAWAPSGGNSQPWSISALAPAAARALLQRYEEPMWAALLPRVVHMRRALDGDPRTRVERARQAIQHDVLIEGRPWLLFVWSSHEAVDPAIVREVHEALGERSPSLAVMQRASGELDREVTAASVAGFVYGLTLLAHARGWGACWQSSWLAFEDQLLAELPAPVPGARLAGAVMVGYTARELPPRPRKPIPIVWR